MKLDRLYYFSLFLGFILGVRGGFIALWPEDQPEKAKYKKIMRFANGEVTTVEDNA